MFLPGLPYFKGGARADATSGAVESWVYPPGVNPTIGAEGIAVGWCATGGTDDSFFLLVTTAAIPPPRTAPAVNTAACMIAALGIFVDSMFGL